MRRFPPGLLILGLCLLSGNRAAAQEPFAPAAVLRLAPLDQLLGDAKYVVKQTQREQIGKQFEGILKGLTGPKGLQGVDTKKPLGVYATVDKSLDHSQVVLLVPVADEKAFLELLKELNVEAEKGDGGVYTVKVENVPIPLLMRFANGYAYATLKFSKDSAIPAADKLPKPEDALGKTGPAVSLTAHIDRVPEQVRKLVVSGSALQLGDLKDAAVKGETEAQKAFRGALLDEMASLVKSLAEEGGPVGVEVGIDQKNHDLTLSVKAAGRKGTALAKRIAALGKAKGLAGLIGKDSALGGFVNVSLPKDLIKPLGPVVDEGFDKALGSLDDEGKRLVEPVVKALGGTAKSGDVDVAFDLRGPNKDGRYTLVTGLKVKDGDRIEAAVKKLVGQLPDSHLQRL